MAEIHVPAAGFARLRQFLSYYRPYRRLLLADLACALVVSGTALLLPLAARHITQNLLTATPDAPDTLPAILVMGGVMLGLLALQTLCNLFVDYQGHMMGAKMESDMRRDLFDHYLKLSFRFYDDRKTGDLMSRITGDLFAISELAHHGPEDLTMMVLNFTGAFVILLHINVPLTLLIFAFVPVMAVYAFHFNRRMNRALGKSRERISAVNTQVEDTLAGIRVVKSFANEALEAAKFADANARFLASRGDGYRSEAYFSNGINAFTQLFTITVIIFGAISITRHTLALPDLLTFLLYVGSLTEPVRRAVNFSRLYQEGITGFNRFVEIMQVQPDIEDAPEATDPHRSGGHSGGQAGGQSGGQIEFRDVSFRYRTDQREVLTRLNLRIHAGEYVALVGTSGVGKTTLCNLIPRFYDVTGGAIHLNGHDIRDLCQDALRQQIGMVQQDVYLFAGTVADNIRYGRLDATDAEIIAAAKLAHAHDFIMALPHGYQTDIGQRGVKLSGGQKQRLSIARVFLKDPPVIIFDEATSALDNESERAVQASLERLTANRTMLVIAHRLSTVRNAGRIIVMTEDGIAEEGTHEDLLARDGTYARLHRLQLRL